MTYEISIGAVSLGHLIAAWMTLILALEFIVSMAAMRRLRVQAHARAGEADDLRDALQRIARSKTRGSNATVKRMAAIATDALEA